MAMNTIVAKIQIDIPSIEILSLEGVVFSGVLIEPITICVDLFPPAGFGRVVWSWLFTTGLSFHPFRSEV